MKRVFIDTNVWLRYLVSDNKQAQECAKLINSIEKGLFLPYTSTIVLLEVAHTLRSYYRLNNPKIVKVIENILKTRGLTLLEETSLLKALDLHKKTRVKLTDCLIATQLPKGVLLVTYDKEFKKIPKLKPKTPAEVLKIL